MSQEQTLILLTRPQQQSERFAQMCHSALGIEQQIIQSPLLKIEILPVELDVSKYQGLIFTSENGVRAYVHGQYQSRLPAYCVGERTAKAARAAGLTAYSAKGSAEDLVALVQSVRASGPMLHIRGEHTRGNIADRMNVQVDEVVAYRQMAESLSEKAQSVLAGKEVVILPLFSPRTARIFFEDANPVTAPLRVVAISEAVKDAVLGSNIAKSIEVLVADAPDALAMLRAIKTCIVT